MTESRPTAKQLSFARTLKIDLPENLTRTELSRLIEHVLTRQRIEDTDLHSMPNDTPLWKISNIPNAAYTAEACEAIKQSGIRRGDIVKHEANFYYAVGSIDPRYMWLTPLNKSIAGHQRPTCIRDKDGRLTVGLKIIYRPPCTYEFWRLVHTTSHNLYSLFQYPYLCQKLFLELMARHLSTEERFTNQYGEFWSLVAVERNRLAIEREIKDLKNKTSTTSRSKPERYCRVCGKKCTKYQNYLTCYACSADNKLPARERYCIRCGSLFTYEKGSGVKGCQTFICPDHRT